MDITSFDEKLRNLLSVLCPRDLESYNEYSEKVLRDFRNLPRKINFTDGHQILKEREILVRRYFNIALLFMASPEFKSMRDEVYSYFTEVVKAPIASPNCPNCHSSHLELMVGRDNLICMNCGLEQTQGTPDRKTRVDETYNRATNMQNMVSELRFLNIIQKEKIMRDYNRIQKKFNELSQEERGNRKNFFRLPFVLKFLCEKNGYPLFSTGESICSELINSDIKDPQLSIRCQELLEKLYSSK
jgi:hypothetical protein